MTNHQSLEQLLNDTNELLRCAKATAYESADSLSGSQRDHAFSVMHLIEMARCKMEDAVKFSHSAPHPRDAA